MHLNDSGEFAKHTLLVAALTHLQGGPKKMAQSLWHHYFATVHHRVMRFSTKCSERNSLHD